MSRKVELLAPAGNREAFVAAVENGADAVYIGGQKFSARQYAANFDTEEMEWAVEYAHLRGARVYLAMNTLLDDREIEQALEYLKKPVEMGIDALIVQDPGFASAVRQVYPGIDLHASTQMTIYNIEGVRALEKEGFKRVILARELSLCRIEEICRNTNIEIEVFVHGALCVSYSGQCLMSSMIGGRSGNRGKCAQPCRQRYDFINIETGYLEGDGREKAARKYLLSPRDQCTVGFLDRIVATGVRSLKIEGRMKSPEYVAVVTGIYRKYLDRALEAGDGGYSVDEKDLEILAQIFNRGGFNRGYFFGKTGKDMMCFEKPKNWGIYLGEAISYRSDAHLLKVRLANPISIGDGVEVWTNEDESPGNIITEIRVNGRRTDRAEKGQTAEIGSLSIAGKIPSGCKVYKTSDKNFLDQARKSYEDKSRRKTALHGFIEITEGERTVLRVSDDLGNSAVAVGDMEAETAVTRPISESRVVEQLSKTGNTPFYFSKIDVKITGNPALPVSEINSLRRKALGSLEREIIDCYRRDGRGYRKCGGKDTGSGNSGSNTARAEQSSDPERIYNAAESFGIRDYRSGRVAGISVYFAQIPENIEFAKIKAARVHIPFKYVLDRARAEKTLFAVKGSGAEAFIRLPHITSGNYDRLIREKLAGIAEIGFDGLTLGNIGTLEAVKEILGTGVSDTGGQVSGSKKFKLSADYTLNAFNGRTVGWLRRSGFDTVTLSTELNLDQIERLKLHDLPGIEAMVYGRVAVMTSEYCPAGCICGGASTGRKCAGCSPGRKGLRDRTNAVFPVVTDNMDCRSSIYNSATLLVPELCGRLKKSGVELFRLDFLFEDAETVYDVTAMYSDVLKYGDEALEKYAPLVERLRAGGFTRGHYFRGV